MPTAVSYARFSSDRQHESSIEAQHAAIDAYAARHGITIVRRYVDRAKSGTSDNRPDFLNMLSDLKTLSVDFVLVHKVDRFARNRYNAAVASRIITERGAKLVAVAQDFGDGPEAVIMEALMQGMAEYYSLNLSTEVIKGRKQNIKKGRHPGGMYPFGYLPDGNGGYVINDIEAYYVRRLYQAVIDGTPSCKSICDEMREIGVHGRRGSFLVPGNVAGMLKKPIYAGIYHARAGNEQNTIADHHPAIVSKETYEEALAIMEARKNTGRKPRREYLCTGLTFCGACGAPMYGHHSSRGQYHYITYVCSKSCGGIRAIRMDELDQAACNFVSAVLAPSVREQLTAAMAAYIEGQRKQTQRRAPDAKKEIDKLQSQIDTLTANMSVGVLPASVLERLGRQITELEAQIEVLQEMTKAPPPVETPHIEDYFADASTVTPDDDPVHAQKVLRRFIARITVHPHSIEFESTFDAWLRKHFPGFAASRVPLSPEGADDPKGAESSAATNSSARPDVSDDDPDNTTPSGSSGSPSTPPTCSPASSNSLIPASNNDTSSAYSGNVELSTVSEIRRNRLFLLQTAIIDALNLNADLFIQTVEDFACGQRTRTLR